MDSGESQDQITGANNAESTIQQHDHTTEQPISFEDVLQNNAEAVSEETEEEKRSLLSGRGKVVALGSLAFVAAVGIGITGTLLLGPRQVKAQPNGSPDRDGSKDTQTSASPFPAASPIATISASPEASPSATPQNEESPTPEILASQSKEDIAKDVLNQVVQWRSTGISAEQQAASGLSIADYAAKTASETEDIYTSNLFIDNWKYNTDLKTFAELIHQEQEDSIGLTLVATHKPFPFTWNTEYQSYQLVNETAGEMNLVITFFDANNAIQFDEAANYPKLNRESNAYNSIAVRLFKNDDTLKIADIQMFESQ